MAFGRRLTPPGGTNSTNASHSMSGSGVTFGKKPNAPTVPDPLPPIDGAAQSAQDNIMSFPLRDRQKPVEPQSDFGEELKDDLITSMPAANELAIALVDYCATPLEGDGRMVHANSVVAVAAALLGQAALRMVYGPGELTAMRRTLPMGLANDPLFADVTMNRIPAFLLFSVMLKDKIPVELQPDAYSLAVNLAKPGAKISVAPNHYPQLDPLAHIGCAEPISRKIAEQHKLGARAEMLMVAGAVIGLIMHEPVPGNALVLMRLAMEVALISATFNTAAQTGEVVRFGEA